MSSSIVDEDTARSLDSGRQTIGAVLSTIQTHLQKVFIIFVVGFLGTFYALRAVVWDWLRAVTESEMPAQVAAQHEIIVTTPFEVILLQAKIGIVAGIIIAIPPLLYLSRHELRARGYWPQTPIARWKLVGIVLMSISLFAAGVAYAYGLFFPLILGFLAEFSYNVGIDPTWSIVMWTELLVLLTISFGLAAQLPLAMTSLAYAEIVPYETFRDKWKHAIVGIFVFGAMFSPPDPISQIMWALPLIVLYAFSLGMTRFIVTLKRGGRANVGRTVKRNVGTLFGIPLLLATGLYAALVSGLLTYTTQRFLLPRDIVLPEARWLQELLGVPQQVALAVGAAAILFVFVFLLVGFYLLVSSVEEAPAGSTGRMGDPGAIDLSTLDATGIEAAPAAAFEELTEKEALALARDAMEADNPEKAQAILDRFDAVHGTDDSEGTTAEAVGDTEGEAANADTDATDDDEDEDVGGVLTGTASGMFAAFSDEKDEDDIGGYIYDVKYIADSLRSRLLWIFAVFGLALIGVFTFFYMGGVRIITQDFVSRMPRAVVSIDDIRIIDLHPVETLIFIIKVSTLAGALAVLPMVIYYAWPAMKERGLTTGQRSVVYEWTITIALALGIGTFLGYYYIAPGLIGFLVYDAVQGGMLISYRISKFSWLIIYTTVGVGLLACVPLTMWMLFRGKVASYGAMRNRWREVTIAVFAVAGLVTPVSVLTMFIVAIPTMLAYGLGLGGLWAITLGGRRDFGEEVVETDGGNARWLALIVAALVLVGGAVAMTGGIGALVSEDGRIAGMLNDTNEGEIDENASADPADRPDTNGTNDNNASGDANDTPPEDNDSAVDEDGSTNDTTDTGGNDTETNDAAEENSTPTENESSDEEDDDGAGIDLREPLDG
ncbi:twin-arginine translocase subunit TatC [Halalkalicoccus subterraneus]|uniref:twin-arginine translocase subunit TatC n=1 Tax=Halalkalicoccus subterraneus TaxID=2675002 RepID=UPI000EFCD88E|nr:twin-arginine translocase subunit TatC [Halalkalicoccus subterraneus]